MVLQLPPLVTPPPKPPPAPSLPAPYVPATAVPMQTETGETTTRFKSNVNLEFRTKSSTSLRDRLAALLATLQRVDPTCIILPLPEHSSSPNITSPTEMPVDTATFHHYLTLGTATRTGSKHHLFLSTSQRINQLKNIPLILNHLKTSHIWLRYNTLSSTNITAIGWMFRVNPDAYSRADLYSHMVQCLGGNFTAFQLNARSITHQKDGKLQTRAWVVEMDKTDAKTWFKIFLETFPIGGSEPQLIPFSASTHSASQSIRKVFYLHNKSLNDSELIRIDNLRGLEQKLYSKDEQPEPTLRQSLTSLTTRADPSTPLFFSVSQYNSGRVTLLLRKSHLEEAHELLDHLLDSYIPSLHPDSQALLTFPEKPPLRIGRPSLPEHIAILTKAIDQLPIELDFDDTSHLTPFSTPPPRYQRGGKSYATAVTGPSTPAQTTHAASSHPITTASDLTNERTLLIDQLLSDLSTKHSSLAQEQHQTSQRVQTLESQLATTLQKLTSMNNLLQAQQESIHRITDMLTRIEPLLQKASSAHLTIRKQSRTSTVPLPLTQYPTTRSSADSFDYEPEEDPPHPPEPPSQQ